MQQQSYYTGYQAGGYAPPGGQQPVMGGEAPRLMMPTPSAVHIGSSTSQVELHVGLRNLIKLDKFSLSDPCVRVEYFDGSKWRILGQTEWLKNQKNCQFVKAFKLDYFFHQEQHLLFSVWDVDNPKAALESQEFVGECRCTLGQVVGSRGGAFVMKIINPRKGNRHGGELFVSAEEVASCALTFTFNFSANNLDKKDRGPLGKSDPFLAIYRERDGGPPILAHKTEVLRRTLKPNWKPFVINSQELCNGDLDRTLILDVYDWDRDGGHDYIGRCTTTVNEIYAGKKQWPLVNEKKKMKKKKYSNSGVLTCHSMSVERIPTFVDYLAGGCEIALTFSVDFTGSNGNPASPTSLHYINPYKPNEYQQAILAVGNILKHYDSDGMFPAYGFGCWFPPRRQVLSLFPLNGNQSNHECQGIEGVLAAYQQVLPHARLSGPTNFAPTIRAAARQAEEAHREMAQRNQKYHILVIITDGEITDLPNTMEEIIKASVLPLSIIIVGVGDCDFARMEVLDSDDKLLTYQGHRAQRDIVQFVPFRKYRNSPHRLAAETLAEVPPQFMKYMKLRKIVPNPRMEQQQQMMMQQQSQSGHGQNEEAMAYNTPQPQQPQQPLAPSSGGYHHQSSQYPLPVTAPHPPPSTNPNASAPNFGPY